MPSTAFAVCTRCGDFNDDRRRHARGDYLAMCRTCERAHNREQRAARATRSVPRIPATRLGAARRFGIEIECIFPGGTSGAENMLRPFLPANWRIKYDGSLGYNGIEVVSPPISGESGLNQVKMVVEKIRELGGSVDRSCGLHVHHEVSDIGAVGLSRFIRSWHEHRSLLDRLVSPSRRGNRYCNHLSDSSVVSIERWGRRYGLDEDNSARYAVPNLGRYHAVNVLSYARYGTVEVRQHQGTLSFRKIEAWIKLAQGMLDSVAVTANAVEFSPGYRSFFERIGLDEDTAAYLIGRAVQFGAYGSAVTS